MRVPRSGEPAAAAPPLPWENGRAGDKSLSATTIRRLATRPALSGARTTMTATLFRLARTTAPAASALVVQPNLSELLVVLSTLSSIGFDVIVAQTFQDARRSLAGHRPSLLLTDVRLHDYNGLHLIHRMQGLWKNVPAILTSVSDDVVLRDEAERLGATFVVLPISAGDLMAAVYRTALRSGTETIRAPYERRQSERRQRLSPFSETDRRGRERRRRPGALLQMMASLS